jgi:hypothetical protein
MLFYRHYFSPLKAIMRKGRIWSRSQIREAQKHADPADPAPVPEPDPQHLEEGGPDLT